MPIRRLLSRIALLALVSPCLASPSAGHPDDAEIARQLIRQSIASYPGNCPCPYNSMANGRACGKRSAYSRPGGQAPLCYAEDVTPAMIQRYRQHG